MTEVVVADAGVSNIEPTKTPESKQVISFLIVMASFDKIIIQPSLDCEYSIS